jgi:hypothetical protein
MVEIHADYGRSAQLGEYASALAELAAFLTASRAYLEQVEPLGESRTACLGLLERGCTQADLSDLPRGLQPFIETLKKWLPPAELAPDGRLVVPPWLPELEARHRRARAAAFALRVLGEH